MNKKIIVIVVIAECILAILLISFLGKAIESYIKTVYSEDVYFVTKEGEKIPDDTTLEIKLSDADISYQLYWVVETKRTTKKEVTFVSNKPEEVIVDKTGLVTFLIETDAIITVSTMDGSEKSDSITVVPVRDIDADVDID